MVEVAIAFLGVAALTFVGFGAGRVFQKTRFPDAPLLLAAGLLLGPINRILVAHGVGSVALAAAFDPVGLQPAAPFIAALALVVILFDSGLELKLGAVRATLGPAVVHTVPIFILTVGTVAVLAHLLFGLPWLVGVVLGVAMASVDQTVASGVVSQMRVPDSVRSVSVVEMALYDIASIPILVSLLALAAGSSAVDGVHHLGDFARNFATILAVSIVVGGPLGLLWAYALRWLRGHPHSYMLTFATVLTSYGLAELGGGSGAISILLFGLVVGNRQAVLRGLSGIRERDHEGAKVQAFHDEITFFVRTLFFLFVGINFTFSLDLGPDAPGIAVLGRWGRGDALAIVGAAILTAGIVAARWVAIRITANGRATPRRLLFPVFGRGLDTAVLASLPFVTPGFVPGSAYHTLFAPWQALFLNLAFLVILMSVVCSSVLVFVQDRRRGPAFPVAPRSAGGALPPPAPERVAPRTRPRGQAPQAAERGPTVAVAPPPGRR